jgi:hypothetical protein
MGALPARSALALLALLLPLGACTGPDGQPLIRAGGRYSGVPDTVVGDPRQPLGTMSTDGTIRLGRENPPGREGAALRRLTPFY